MDQRTIQKALEDGRDIANMIRNTKTTEEIEKLSKRIDAYSEFVDEHFGVLNDWGERTCELSAMLYQAADEKDRHLRYNYEHPEAIGNDDIDLFVELLDSKTWIKKSKNAE